jgi:hypothetical protein
MVGHRQAGLLITTTHQIRPASSPAARLRKPPKRWLQDFGWSGLLFEAPVFRRFAFINAP